MLYLEYFKSLLLISYQFYFNWYSNFQTSLFISSHLLFFYILLLTPISTLFKFVLGERSDSFDLTFNPLLYQENRLNYKRRKLIFLSEAMLKPYLISILIFYLTMYHHANAYDEYGNPSQLSMLFMNCFFISLMVFHSQIIFFIGHKFKSTFSVLALLSLGLCLIIFLNGSNSTASSADNLVASKYFIQNPSAIISSILVFFFCFQFLFVLHIFVQPKLFPSLLSRFEDESMMNSISRREEIKRLGIAYHHLIPLE